jgi:transcriptional regulator with XRE-family HTH domain
VELNSWAAIGHHVKRAREGQGLSQTELAQRSGVNISSVFRVEKGKAIRLATVRRIAKGLDIVADTILRSREFPPESAGLLVHRVSKATWYAEQDRRARIPGDHFESYQDAAERRRIGRLGFVSWFGCPPTAIMKNGPGIVLLEIHGLGLDAFNHQFYKDAVIYALRGSVSVTAKSETVHLNEGDWVGFKSSDLESIAPREGQENQPSAPQVLWIGANRFGKRKRGKAEKAVAEEYEP